MEHAYFIVFDTETTGIPDFNAPISETHRYPFIVQLSWVVCDNSGHIIKDRDFIIKPDNWIIPETSTQIHGITQERALFEGVGIDEALNTFSLDFIGLPFYSVCFIAHNYAFDATMLAVEYLRNGMKNYMAECPHYCTMKNTINFVNPETKRYPKLSALYAALFGVVAEGTHNAKNDVLYTKECFFELVRRHPLVSRA